MSVSVTAEAPENSATVEAEASAVEATADAAVAVAEIEANRDVAIAEIAAETAEAAIAADAADHEEDVEWLQNAFAAQSDRLATIDSRLETMALILDSLPALILQQSEALASLTALLTPPSPSEPAPEAETTPAAEALDATAADGPRESQEESPPAKTPARRQRNWL
jgi:hypothetical protein